MYQDFESTDATTDENTKVDRSSNNPVLTDDRDSENSENGYEKLQGEVRNSDLKVDIYENIDVDRNSNHSGSCNSATIERSDSESPIKADSDLNKIRNGSIGSSSCGDHRYQEVIELDDIAKTKKEAVSSEPNKSAAETEEVLNPLVVAEIKMAGNDSEELRVLDENENPRQGRLHQRTTPTER